MQIRCIMCVGWGRGQARVAEGTTLLPSETWSQLQLPLYTIVYEPAHFLD
jgi:hypothetical protein